eukprot:440100_1
MTIDSHRICDECHVRFKNPLINTDPKIQHKTSIITDETEDNKENQHIIFIDKCDLSITKCQCAQNVLLLLQKQINKCDEDVVNFLNNAKNYDHIQLMKDFIHCRSYHLQQIKHKNNCNKQQCFIRLRHVQREENMYNRQDIQEINILQYIDMIHSILFHSNTITDRDSSVNLNKFVTIIEGEETDTDTKENDILDIPNYQFGHQFEYWNENLINFVVPKFKTLKEEYLNNSLFQLCLSDFELLLKKAIDFTEIYKQNMIRAKRSQNNIQLNDEMSLEHIMVVISYCSMDEMQRKYKLGCQEMKCDKTIADVKKRHSEITIWFRLFQEVMDCFGEIFQRNDTVYHGLCKKLLFSKMGTTFNLPTSCTKSLAVAQRFATDLQFGIVIELQRNQSEDILNYYFDVYSQYLFSPYPNEQECIVFGAWFGFKDILYEDIYGKLAHSEYISCLCLYQKIIYGEWFS